MRYESVKAENYFLNAYNYIRELCKDEANLKFMWMIMATCYLYGFIYFCFLDGFLKYFSIVFAFILILLVHFVKRQTFEISDKLTGFLLISLLYLSKGFYSTKNSTTIKTIELGSFTSSFCQMSNFFCWIFFETPENQIGVEIFTKIIYLLFNKIFYGMTDNLDILDMIISSVYFIMLSLYIEKIKIITNESSMVEFKSLNKHMMNISDKFNEYYMILGVSKDIKENDLFGTKYNLEIISFSQFFNNQVIVKPESILEKYYYVPKDQINDKYIQDIQNNNNFEDNLLNDIYDYISEAKLNDNIKFKQNFYIFENKLSTNVDGYDKPAFEFYDVKFGFININSDKKNHLKNLIISFKSISLENFHLKCQQLSSFSGVILSTLTHELKNPLTGLSGELYSMKSESKSCKQENILIEQIIQNDPNYKNKLFSSPIIEELKKINTKKSYKNEKLKSDLLSRKLIKENRISGHIKFSNYVLKKLNLIIENLEIFAKIKLKQTLYAKFTEINLNQIIKKSTKMLESIMELNNNRLNMEIVQANSYVIKTDSKKLETIIQNILLVVEKTLLNSRLDINVSLGTTSKAEEKLGLIISFTLHNPSFYFKSCEKDESLEVMDIFSRNNKRLAKLINVDYIEEYIKDSNTLKYQVTINNFSSSSHDTQRLYSRNNLQALSDGLTVNNDIQINLSPAIEQKIDYSDILIKNPFVDSTKIKKERPSSNYKCITNTNSPKKARRRGSNISLNISNIINDDSEEKIRKKPTRKIHSSMNLDIATSGRKSKRFDLNISVNNITNINNNKPITPVRTFSAFKKDNRSQSRPPTGKSNSRFRNDLLSDFLDTPLPTEEFECSEKIHDLYVFPVNKHINSVNKSISAFDSENSDFSVHLVNEDNKYLNFVNSIDEEEKKNVNDTFINDLNNEIKIKSTIPHFCDCPKVIVADDDMMISSFLKKLISQKVDQQKILTAANGQIAFDIFKTVLEKDCHFCKKDIIIIMDFLMPIMNGDESAKLINSFYLDYIKGHPNSASCKLYFVSSNVEALYGRVEDIFIFKGYFNKPIEKKTILGLFNFN